MAEHQTGVRKEGSWGWKLDPARLWAPLVALRVMKHFQSNSDIFFKVMKSPLSFCLDLIGKNPVIWSPLAWRQAEKCGLLVSHNISQLKKKIGLFFTREGGLSDIWRQLRVSATAGFLNLFPSSSSLCITLSFFSLFCTHAFKTLLLENQGPYRAETMSIVESESN